MEDVHQFIQVYALVKLVVLNRGGGFSYFNITGRSGGFSQLYPFLVDKTKGQ